MKRKHTSKRALRKMRRRVEQTERENAALRGLVRYRADETVDHGWTWYAPAGWAMVPLSKVAHGATATIREATISPHHFEAD